jgi:Asp-tRNA(Asn)/Glu-tRNA(Gln) amidotransferase A subunit family amidase
LRGHDHRRPGHGQARQADSEIAAGHYKGPLHGLPWGCKDIIAVPGYPTTWGSNAFKDQIFEKEATIVRLLREAGAVVVAKLMTGELAGGDWWFGGRTNNPWDLNEGSSGSSAGHLARQRPADGQLRHPLRR